ncbi:MAG: PAS domain S-box protein [Candidatus Marinimicrobia bacterium]|nr:PAS domain S-box protein [Candidatus Neomarinimicrobiota bacterium]
MMEAHQESAAAGTAHEAGAALAEAIRQAAETIVVTDTVGCLTYVNPAFEQITGYRAEEAIGRHVRFLKSGQHPEAFYRAMWRTLGAGETWRGHFVNRRKNGILYEEEASISPVRNADGCIQGYVAVKRDVSEQMELERRLARAQKMTAIGQLAGGIAHDFNNVLQAMVGNLQLLQSHTPRATDQPLLDELMASARRARDLVRQLLIFAQRQPSPPVPTDLSQILDNLRSLLARTIEDPVQLVFPNRTNDCWAAVDAGEVEQALVHLAVNARDAMPVGGTISFTCDRIEMQADALAAVSEPLDMQPGPYCALTVRDTGLGIAPDIRDRIFEPFFTTKPMSKGNGMGLPLVHGIARRHHGGLHVASAPGAGTAVTLYFPVCAAAAPTAPRPPATDPQPSETTVLLVEDEELVRRIAARLLRHQGYTVHEAACGEQALEMLAALPAVDVLVSDVVMPGISGAELAVQVRKLYPHMALLLLSGYPRNHLEQQGLSLGEIPLLAKPLRIEDVDQAIRAQLAVRP